MITVIKIHVFHKIVDLCVFFNIRKATFNGCDLIHFEVAGKALIMVAAGVTRKKGRKAPLFPSFAALSA